MALFVHMPPKVVLIHDEVRCCYVIYNGCEFLIDIFFNGCVQMEIKWEMMHKHLHMENLFLTIHREFEEISRMRKKLCKNKKRDWFCTNKFHWWIEKLYLHRQYARKLKRNVYAQNKCETRTKRVRNE